MSLANPLWGAPRLQDELLKLGFELAQSTVATYMARGRFPPSQSWKIFLRNHANGLAATDLVVVPTIGMRLRFGLVMVCVERRLVVMTAVTMHPTAEWIARQITEAFAWGLAPEYLTHDRDSSYGPVFRRRLQAMGIRDRPTAPRSPWQNCYAERLIGSIRRECPDHVIVLGEEHLRRVLKHYVVYYNRSRPHLSLANPWPRILMSIGQSVARGGSRLCLSWAVCTTATPADDYSEGTRRLQLQSETLPTRVPASTRWWHSFCWMFVSTTKGFAPWKQDLSVKGTASRHAFSAF